MGTLHGRDGRCVVTETSLERELSMQTLERVGALVGRWFAVIVVVAGAIALLTPETFAAGGPAVSVLLALLLLGMGLSLQPRDFVTVVKRSWPTRLRSAA